MVICAFKRFLRRGRANGRALGGSGPTLRSLHLCLNAGKCSNQISDLLRDLPCNKDEPLWGETQNVHYGKVRGDAVEIIEVKWLNGTGRWWPSRTVKRRSWFWISRKGYESRGFGQRPDGRVSRQYKHFVQGAPGATHRVERRTGINSTYECIERGAVPEPIIVGGQRVSGQPIGRGQRRLGKGHPGDPSVVDGVSLMKTVINQLQFNPMQVAQKRNQRCYDHLLPTHE